MGFSPAAKVTYETSTGDEAYDAYEVGVVAPPKASRLGQL